MLTNLITVPAYGYNSYIVHASEFNLKAPCEIL